MMIVATREIIIDIATGIFILVSLMIMFQSDHGVLEVPELSIFGWGAIVALIVGWTYLDNRILKAINAYKEDE